ISRLLRHVITILRNVPHLPWLCIGGFLVHWTNTSSQGTLSSFHKEITSCQRCHHRGKPEDLRCGHVIEIELDHVSADGYDRHDQNYFDAYLMVREVGPQRFCQF